MSDSKSTEEKLGDLIDVLDGPPGFVRDLNDLISKHVVEARIDEIRPGSVKEGTNQVRIHVPQRNHINNTDYDKGWNDCWDAFWTARWERVGELSALNNQTKDKQGVIKPAPLPPEGCICASFWTIRQAHKNACPLANSNPIEVIFPKSAKPTDRPMPSNIERPPTSAAESGQEKLRYQITKRVVIPMFNIVGVPRHPTDKEKALLNDYISNVAKFINSYAQKKYQEGEWVAAKKIQQVIDAHEGINSDSEVLELVKASLEVIDKLEKEEQ